jgi:hypothetical protein
LSFSQDQLLTLLVPVAATMVEKCEETHPPVPRSIHDISNGAHILGFGAELGEDHPVGSQSPYSPVF